MNRSLLTWIPWLVTVGEMLAVAAFLIAVLLS
jgi:hypothetical protein